MILVALIGISLFAFAFFFQPVGFQIFEDKPLMYQLAGRDAFCKGTLNRQAPDITVGRYTFQGRDFLNSVPVPPQYVMEVFKDGRVVDTIHDARFPATYDGITVSRWDYERCFTPCDPRYCRPKCASEGQTWILIRYRLEVSAPSSLYDFEVTEISERVYQIKIGNDWLSNTVADYYVLTNTGEKIDLEKDFDLLQGESYTTTMDLTDSSAASITPVMELQINFGEIQGLTGQERIGDGMIYHPGTSCEPMPSGLNKLYVGQVRGGEYSTPLPVVEEEVEPPAEEPPVEEDQPPEIIIEEPTPEEEVAVGTVLFYGIISIVIILMIVLALVWWKKK